MFVTVYRPIYIPMETVKKEMCATLSQSGHSEYPHQRREDPLFKTLNSERLKTDE